jgi:hypothetical protein
MVGMPNTSGEAQAVGHVMERVQARFPHVEPGEIRALVDEVHRQYDGRPIREFVPILVEREVTDALRTGSRKRAPVIPQQAGPARLLAT